MYVTQPINFVLKANQLVIMGSKEGTGAEASADVFGDRPRNREAIKGGCSSTDFIQQHQRTGRGSFQDVSHFDHFHHEG